MIEALHREFIYIWYYFDLQFRQIFFYRAVGILIGSLMSVSLKKHIHDRMSLLGKRKMRIWGIIPASVLGILSPLCMYGTIPIAASFSRSGMREGWITTSMMSSILLNPQLFFYSSALGAEIAILRLLVVFICGCAGGLLIHIFFKQRSFYKLTDFDLPENRDSEANIVRRLLKCMGCDIRIAFPYFLLGVLSTAPYQRYVPSWWVTGLFGADQGLGALMATALGIPLYTCGSGTIPLIAAWLGEGMNKSGTTAFMIAGSATKLTNLGAVKIVLGAKYFILYLVFLILMSTGAGILADLLFYGIWISAALSTRAAADVSL